MMKGSLLHSLVLVGALSPLVQAQGPAAHGSKDSCDGALDIVPSQAMTFVRKRRPAKTHKTSPAQVKPEQKPAGTRKPTSYSFQEKDLSDVWWDRFVTCPTVGPCCGGTGYEPVPPNIGPAKHFLESYSV